MPSSKVRIDIPTNADDVIKLAQNIQTKHTALATQSPLTQFNWEVVAAAIDAADQAHKNSKTLAAQAEAATETRDKALVVISGFIRDSRDVLGVVHKSEPRRLSDYGFTVTAGGTSSAKKGGTPPPASN